MRGLESESTSLLVKHKADTMKYAFDQLSLLKRPSEAAHGSIGQASAEAIIIAELALCEKRHSLSYAMSVV